MTILSFRLAMGVEQVAPIFRENIASFVRSKAATEGGFIGRKGKADIYYTGFALRTLALVGELKNDRLAQSTFQYIQHFVEHKVEYKKEPLSMAELVSVLIAATILEQVLETDFFGSLSDGSPSGREEFVNKHLFPLVHDDSAWGAIAGKGHSGVYHTFLAMVCQQLIGRTIAEEERVRILKWLAHHRREDGSFADMKLLPTGATNPTAAAVALAGMLTKNSSTDALFPQGIYWQQTYSFLEKMRTAQGGFCANRRIPLPDLLSTFSALVAILDIQQWEPFPFDWELTRDFVLSLYHQGGFVSGHWDKEPDVEYTFYGLATLGIIYGETIGKSSKTS